MGTTDYTSAARQARWQAKRKARHQYLEARVAELEGHAPQLANAELAALKAKNAELMAEVAAATLRANKAEALANGLQARIQELERAPALVNRETTAATKPANSPTVALSVITNAVEEQLRPLFDRIRDQSKKHEALISQPELATIATDGDRIVDAWANGALHNEIPPARTKGTQKMVPLSVITGAVEQWLRPLFARARKQSEVHLVYLSKAELKMIAGEGDRICGDWAIGVFDGGNPYRGKLMPGYEKPRKRRRATG
jgi:hypothetical protein